MKQTNLFNRLSVGRPRFAKPLGFSVVCLALMFILGTQKSTAQTATELGPTLTQHVVDLIQGEIALLEQELKNPGTTVNTVKNELIVRYYNDVVVSIDAGGDIKKAFLNVESTYGANVASPAGFSTYPQNSVMDPTSSDPKDLRLLVDQLNLFDSDDSDLVALFNYWRTLKNQ